MGVYQNHVCTRPTKHLSLVNGEAFYLGESIGFLPTVDITEKYGGGLESISDRDELILKIMSRVYEDLTDYGADISTFFV